METQVRKKKKSDNHKVTLATDKLEKDCHKLTNIQNAYFPYQPYPQQSALIQKIHTCIKNQQNVLVESPTGTGKTLCMLVASLSCLCSITQSNTKVPKIYYLTRTHSQVTQVINQLKRVPWYQCKINIIASREHMCINRNLRELKGRALDRGCQEMCKQKLCKYKQSLSQNILPFKQWLTLEQLCQKGNKKNFCPFYFSKMSTEKCELTIMPFNYLLDWSLFEHNNFNLKNSVIIFDQAHNVDSLAQQGSSLQIDTELLTQALIEVKNLQQSSKCRYLHKKFQNESQISDSSYISQVKGLIFRMNSVIRQYNEEKNYSNGDEILSIIKRLTNFVMKQEEISGVDLNNYEEYEIIFDKVKKLFYQKKIDSSQFQLFCTIFMRMMKMLDTHTHGMEDYYMYIGPKSTKNYCLKFICLNASFTFKRILQQKPRSIILCSGTLGPFEILQSQLGINFNSKLKIPSFICPQQICVGIIDKSSRKQVKYEFSYQNKGRQEQFQSFGQQLKQIEKIVPNGIVVAFSTYELMQKSMKHCLGLKKPVFYESKNENVQKIYSKYVQSAKSEKGAFLFIVMKGKFSEGINFNDELCRCLIVVGIPFLPPNDYKVMKKKAYLLNKFDRETSQQWYYSQTFKSVNQVIGRVIRSKTDYGCVLLFDQRYSRKDILKQLPSWFVNNVSYQNRHDYLSKVKCFFTKQPWSANKLQDSKKKLLQSSFQLAISKTIISNQGSNRLSLEALLNQQTPVKIKNQHGKTRPKSKQKPKQNFKRKQNLQVKHTNLKIVSDNQSNSQKQDVLQVQTKIDNVNKQIDKKTDKIKRPERPERPWLSIDYFIGEQIKQFIKESKSKQLSNNQLQKEQESVESTAVLTLHSNKRRKYGYL